MNKAHEIEDIIIALGDERQATVLRRFFKTGPGQYGEGDQFLGVRNPQVRSVVKEVWRELSLSEATQLVRSPLHEVRLCGLLTMVEMYRWATKRSVLPCGEPITVEAVVEAYLSLHTHINNWDLVDLSAIKTVGAYELEHPEITVLDEWITSGHTLWQRRISMVSTWISIRHHLYGKALARAEALLDSRENLLHKAAGWMLREVWKRGGKDALEDFLDRNVTRMPAVMLSYACELMSPEQREYWRKQRTKGNE